MDRLKEISDYCLNCINKPCENNGCPQHNNIPEFLHAKSKEDAYEIITRTNLLPAITGRICPFSKQCQGSCTRNYTGEPVNIGEYEAIIGDYSIEKGLKISKDIDEKLIDKKVCIIGSGPCGLTCAGFLARKGVKVTLLEKNNELGGLLRFGIPDFRLGRELIDKTIEKILELGVEVHTNTKIESYEKLKELTKEYDYVFLATGANEPKITLEGNNVLSANKILEEINIQKEKIKFENLQINKNSSNLEYEKLNESQENNNEISLNTNQDDDKIKYKIPDFANKKVIVSGGGNVAIDIARTLVRYNADVTVVYRRSEKEMPAETIEIEKAKEENVKFLFQTNILSKEDKQIKCIKTKLVQTADDERPHPVNIENTEFYIDCDYVLIATGSTSDKEMLDNCKIETKENGYVKVNENFKTSNPKIFAGGDIVGTKATVANAARNGYLVANEIIKLFEE